MLWAWIFLPFHCLCCKSSLRLLDILTGCLSVCIRVAVFVYSILLTAFSRSITCLVKLRAFAEFTSHIAVWGNITERCVLSLEGFLKRQENPLSCCWGPLFIIQLLSLCTVLTLDQTRKNIFVVVVVSLDSYWGGTYLSLFWQKYLSLLLSSSFISLPVQIFQIIFFPKGKSVAFELSQFPSSHSGLNFSLCTSQSALVLLLLLTRVSVALESHSESALIISKACSLFVAFCVFIPPQLFLPGFLFIRKLFGTFKLMMKSKLCRQSSLILWPLGLYSSQFEILANILLHTIINNY